jgi:hypothetical protein
MDRNVSYGAAHLSGGMRGYMASSRASPRGGPPATPLTCCQVPLAQSAPRAPAVGVPRASRARVAPVSGSA